MGTGDFPLRGNHSDMELNTYLHLVQRLRMHGAPLPVAPQLRPAVTYCSRCVLRGHVAGAVGLTSATVYHPGTWRSPFSGDTPERQGHFPSWLQPTAHGSKPRT